MASKFLIRFLMLTNGERVGAAADGRPAAMANLARHLGSRASGYVTGAIIPVDGGLATTA